MKKFILKNKTKAYSKIKTSFIASIKILEDTTAGSLTIGMKLFACVLLFQFFMLSQRVSASHVLPHKSTEDYFTPDYLRFENIIYKENIKTVQLAPSGAELAFPIIELNGEDKLQLSFDDLDADRKTYNYTLIHCDASWNPTNMVRSDYLSGFNDELITDYKFSFNSIQRYTHFNLVFPTDGIKITKSGNYIIKVFQDYDEQNVVLTRRFLVYDKKVDVVGSAKVATIINDRYTKQEVDFNINNPDFEINDPFENLKVTLLQNQRFDNAITSLKPTFTKPGQLVYDYDEGNVFNGGNEFRYFEDKVFNAPNERISRFVFDEKKQNNVYLLPEEKRAFKRYSSMRDINGSYVIRTLAGYDGDTDGDYAYVHFSLPCVEPLQNAEVYVFGALSNWNYLPEFKMNYDTTFSTYVASPYLKQGYYNYSYVVLKNGETIADESTFEANHYETENDYYILVYYKTFGTYYYQLIGYKRLNSTGK